MDPELPTSEETMGTLLLSQDSLLRRHFGILRSEEALSAPARRRLLALRALREEEREEEEG